MGKYGEAAIRAVSLTRQSQTKNPVDAWKRAVAEIFPNQPASQKKGCPRDAFLGLCQEGLLRSVPRGQYTISIDSKRYALKAVSLLNQKPDLVNDRRALWSEVMEGVKKTENQQMDVVISLWREGEIITGNS